MGPNQHSPRRRSLVVLLCFKGFRDVCVRVLGLGSIVIVVVAVAVIAPLNAACFPGFTFGLGGLCRNLEVEKCLGFPSSPLCLGF